MKKELRKKELIKIAYELFITKGYEDTSVDEIIKVAGIAKGTYYYYFKSKEQTLEEVINMIIDKCVFNAKQILLTDMQIEQNFLNLIFALRLDAQESNFQSVIHNPKNLILHEKINTRLIQEAIPILSELVKEGISIGLFNCDNIEERVKMTLIMSKQLFDHQKTNENTILVFIDTVEKMLGAKKGSLSIIKKLIKE